jgi:hypothetical protein
MAKKKQHQGSTISKIDAPDGGSSLLVIQAGPDEDESSESKLDASAEMFYIAQRERVQRAGLAHLPGAEALLRQKQREYRAKLEREIRAEGIAPGIIELFEAPTKKAAIDVARRLTITNTQFANLVINAQWQLGYRHRQRIRDFRPNHHEAFSDDISRALGRIKGPGPVSADVAKDLRKMNALSSEHKHVVAHLFSKGAKWHCFFFDFDDLLGEHHTGPHLHYISHRWSVPGVTCETVLDAFETRRNSLPRGEHIKFVDPRAGSHARGKQFMGKGTPHILRIDRPAKQKESSMNIAATTQTKSTTK